MSSQSFPTVAAAGSGRTTSPHIHHSASLIRPFLLPANWLIFQIDYTTCQPDLRLHPECLPLDCLPPVPVNPRCLSRASVAVSFDCTWCLPLRLQLNLFAISCGPVGHIICTCQAIHVYVCVSISHDASAPVYLWSCRGHVAARLLSLEHVHSSLLFVRTL